MSPDITQIIRTAEDGTLVELDLDVIPEKLGDNDNDNDNVHHEPDEEFEDEEFD